METVSGPVEPGVAEKAGKATEGFQVAGVPGAICDPETEIGGLSTGIGMGTNEVYDSIKGHSTVALNDAIGVRRIGVYNDEIALRAANEPYPGYIALCNPETDVEPGGVLGVRALSGNDIINETGRTVKAGQYAFGVEKEAVVPELEVPEQKTVKSSKK